MMEEKWRRKVEALRRLADDQAGKPEGELARQKMSEIIAKHSAPTNTQTSPSKTAPPKYRQWEVSPIHVQWTPDDLSKAAEFQQIFADAALRSLYKEFYQSFFDQVTRQYTATTSSSNTDNRT